MSELTSHSEKERIKALFLEAAEREAEEIAELLAGSATEDLLGKTEFALRDAVLKLGAKTLEAATNERSKKGGPRKQYGVSLRRIDPFCKLALEAGGEFLGRVETGLSLLLLSPLRHRRSQLAEYLTTWHATLDICRRRVGRPGRSALEFRRGR